MAVRRLASVCVLFCFFSSRRRHTRFDCDWSSDVCSSDLVLRLLIERGADVNARNTDGRLPLHDCFELGRDHLVQIVLDAGARSDVCAAAAYGMHDRLREILQNDSRQANEDRKSTRLNSSHSQISYAVFCLKKKNTTLSRRLESMPSHALT